MADQKKKLSKKELQAQVAAVQKQKEADKQKLLTPFEIHVMPQKFNPRNSTMQHASKSGSGSKVWLVVIVIIIILALLGYGAFALYKSLNQPAQQPSQNVVTLPTTPVVTQPEVTQPEVTQPEVTQPEVTQPTTPTPTPTTLPTSTDTDGDGLTDVEERLLGTELRIADTDGDGYTDAQEVASLYSPFVAGPSSLADVASINTYVNPIVGYTLLNPGDWLPRITDQSRKEVIFTSITGEVVFLEVLENANNVTIGQWLIDNQPGLNPTTLTNYTSKQGFSGVVTADGLTYYLAIPQKNEVFKFEYDPGTVARLNFKTFFKMMVDSIKLQ